MLVIAHNGLCKHTLSFSTASSLALTSPIFSFSQALAPAPSTLTLVHFSFSASSSSRSFERATC